MAVIFDSGGREWGVQSRCTPAAGQERASAGAQTVAQSRSERSGGQEAQCGMSLGWVRPRWERAGRGGEAGESPGKKPWGARGAGSTGTLGRPASGPRGGRISRAGR